MRLTYGNIPPQYEMLADGKYRVNYNTQEATEKRTAPETGEEIEDTIYLCECVIVEKFNRDAVIVGLIRKVYSADDELAIQRQRDSKPQEFAKYFAYAEDCKVIADEIFNDE